MGCYCSIRNLWSSVLSNLISLIISNFFPFSAPCIPCATYTTLQFVWEFLWLISLVKALHHSQSVCYDTTASFIKSWFPHHPLAPSLHLLVPLVPLGCNRLINIKSWLFPTTLLKTSPVPPCMSPCSFFCPLESPYAPWLQSDRLNVLLSIWLVLISSPPPS